MREKEEEGKRGERRTVKSFLKRRLERRKRERKGEGKIIRFET